MFGKRLDLALNNMSHGLLMINAEGRVTVVNRQLLNLFRLGAEDVRSGASLRAVTRTLMRRKIVARGEIERIWKTLRGPSPGSIWSLRSKRATTARSRSPFIA